MRLTCAYTGTFWVIRKKKKILKMKIGLIISMLLFVQHSWAQIETKIISPKFNEVSNKLNDSTLIDFVKYNKNIIHYRFEFKDTISEFYFVNDTTYKFREIVNQKVFSNGQFKFSPTKIDTTFHYPPGQYEEETIYFIEGKLEKTGWWNESQFKMSGRYFHNKRQGTWNTKENNQRIKMDYDKNGELVSILNPTNKQIEEYSNWLYNPKLKVCTNEQSNKSLGKWIEIVKEDCPCYTKDSSKYFDFKPKLNGKKIENTIFWELEDDRSISLYLDKNPSKYKIWTLGKERIKLMKVENDSNNKK